MPRIATRFIAPLFAVTILVSLMLIGFIAFSGSHYTRQAEIKKMHVLAQALTLFYEQDDPELMVKSIEALSNSQHIKLLHIVEDRTDPHIAYSSHRHLLSLSAEKATDPETAASIAHTFQHCVVHEFYDSAEKTYSLVLPIMREKQGKPYCHAVLVLQISVTGISDEVKSNTAVLCLLVALATLIAMLATWRFFQVSIADPIRKITQTIKDQSNGMLNARTGVMVHDEIGLLAAELNVMLDEKETHKAELLSYTKKMEQKNALLRQLRNDADKANQMKSDFLATMSHEIRTPMNGVIGMTELLIETELSAKQSHYAKTALASAESLMTIINDILDFSKIESGNMQLEPVVTDLQTLVDGVGDILSVKSRAKGVELIVRYGPETAKSVIADPVRLRQVIMNFVGNAIKFTAKGHILLNVERIEEDRITNTQKICFSVSDTGIGIRREAQKHIFNKFTQADASTTRQFGGTGLGLAISKQIIDLMHGEIGVESTVGKGSTFWFTLDLVVAKQEKPDDENRYPLKDINILVVDDREINLTIISEQLRRAGATVLTTAVPEQAMTLLQEAVAMGEPVSIALLDYVMPEMNGEELARTIKANPMLKDTCLIMLSSSGPSGNVRRIERSGFSAVLAKPIQSSRLIDGIQKVWGAFSAGQKTRLIDMDTASSSSAAQSVIFKSPHILLAEDSRVSQEFGVELLQKLGCRVTVAATGLDVQKAVSREKFDLVLMDCEMPLQNGYDATRELKCNIAAYGLDDIPVVALTGNDDKASREACYESGMIDHLLKPIRRESLVETLYRYLPESFQPDALSPVERQFKGQKVLLVEDNRINSEFCMDMLESMGIHVTTAINGQQALDILDRDGPFALLFMDCQMPVMDGYEATRLIRSSADENVQNLPIIALTANAMKGDRERCLAVGMDDYLSKPMHKSDLRIMLNRWLPPEEMFAVDTAPYQDQSPYPVLDKDVILEIKRMMGSYFCHGIQHYLIGSETLLADIRRSVEGDSNPEGVTVLAHMLTGLSHHIGALALANTATNLGLLARRASDNLQGIGVISKQFDELNEIFLQTKNHLQVYMTEDDDV